MHGERKTKRDKNYRLFVVSYSSDNVQCVNSNGNVNYDWCNNVKAVRPFWEGRCNKVGETLKLESLHQKNKQPFFLNKKDKYKGLKYYNRR